MKESFGLSLGWGVWKGQALGWGCPERETWAKSLTLGIRDYLVKEALRTPQGGATRGGAAVAVHSPGRCSVIMDSSTCSQHRGADWLFLPEKLQERWPCVRKMREGDHPPPARLPVPGTPLPSPPLPCPYPLKAPSFTKCPRTLSLIRSV